MTVRTSIRTAVAAGAVVAVVAGGTAVAVAATSSGSAPTGLCLSGTGPVTSAAGDGSGGFTCPSGRSLVVLASDAEARALREGLGEVFTRTHGLQDQAWTLGSRLDGHDGDLLGLGDRLGSAESGLTTAQDEISRTRQQLEQARAELAQTRTQLAALQQRTTTGVKSVPLPLSTGVVRTTVSCDGGTALSGSARTAGARVLQSAVTDDGLGWAFEVEPTTKAPSATLLVVCAGRSVTPGGTTGPGTTPGTGSDTGPVATTAPAPTSP